MEPIAFPDAEAVAISWLADDLAPYSDATVHDAIPDQRPDSFVTIQRTGGPKRDLVTDAPQLTFECFGERPSLACDLANTVRALVSAWRGTSRNGVTVYRVQEFSGPQNLPDPRSKQARYTFTAAVEMRGSVLTQEVS